MGVFKQMWDLGRRVAGLVLPFFAKARDFQSWGPGLRWTVRILLLCAIFVAFLIIQWQAPRDLAPTFLRGGPIASIWLPTFVVLMILFFAVGWWVWKLWMQDEEESPFPDIDQAWSDALRALERAGIWIGDAPLFLVLGQPAAGTEGLFKAAKVEWQVDQAPAGTDHPLHVYATRDAIFVTCPGASLLGQWAKLLASAKDVPADAAEPKGQDGQLYQSAVNVYETIGPEGRAQLIRDILAQPSKENRAISEREQQFLKWLGHVPDEQPAPARKAGAALARDAREIERITARLKHLCRLIVRERQPYCPMNGVLLLVPFAGTEERNANDTATLCQRDIASLREVFRLHFPVLAVVCDMEKAPGFAEFVRQFPQPSRDRRLGTRFPWVLDKKPEELPQTFDDCFAWICHSLPSFWTYGFFQLEPAGKPMAETVRSNGQLFQFMAAMSLRHQGLSRILIAALAPDETRMPLFGGCYLTGTGRKEQEQVFVAGVFEKLIKTRSREVPMQNLVYWNDQALQEDVKQQRQTTLGWASIAGLSALTLGLLGVLIWSFW